MTMTARPDRVMSPSPWARLVTTMVPAPLKFIWAAALEAYVVTPL